MKQNQPQQTPISNKQVSVKWKTIIIAVTGIVSFIFWTGIVYSQILSNEDEISEMKAEVKKIPVIETKLDFLVQGMEQLTNTQLKSK